jgi:hypothetical protein
MGATQPVTERQISGIGRVQWASTVSLLLLSGLGGRAFLFARSMPVAWALIYNGFLLRRARRRPEFQKSRTMRYGFP